MSATLLLSSPHGSSEIIPGVMTTTPPAQRRTRPFLTKFELAKIIGHRAVEIARGINYPDLSICSIIEAAARASSEGGLLARGGRRRGVVQGAEGWSSSALNPAGDGSDDESASNASVYGEDGRKASSTAAAALSSSATRASGKKRSREEEELETLRASLPSTLWRGLCQESANAVLRSAEIQQDAADGVVAFDDLEGAAAAPPPPMDQRTLLASTDPVFLAKWELLLGRVPLIVRRTFPDGSTEDWPLRDLSFDRLWINDNII